VIVAGCSDNSAAGGNGSGGDPSTGGAAPLGGAGGSPSTGGAGAGGETPLMKHVFVTSATFDGNLGGLVGGDLECQMLADAEGLGGTWMAWLSETSSTSPSTRFTQSAEPYVLVGGEQIAADWAALVDGSIDVPINRDETGAEVSAATPDVWTCTLTSGAATGAPCCDNWTSVAKISPVGLHAAVDNKWTIIGAQECSVRAHLYCFEQ
jgi:hypothetical protein